MPDIVLVTEDAVVNFNSYLSVNVSSSIILARAYIYMVPPQNFHMDVNMS